MKTTNTPPIVLPSTATDLTPEDPSQIGSYRLLKRLGAGGMGVVYAGVDAHGGVVAVKVVHAEYAADPEFRARFAREVDLLGRVGGACAVPLLGADPQAARPWLATPFVSGSTLGGYVRRHGPIREPLLRGLAAGVAEALTRIHEAGIAHRDLKPANVILSPNGPRVLDFGIARAVDETALTRTGSVIGSPGWISPDHYRGAPATFADDVFAWGGLVAYAATGRPPFGKGSPDAIGYRVVHEEPDLDGFTGPLADLARAALDKDASKRPTAARLLTGIAAVGQRFAPSVSNASEATHVLSQVLDDNWTGVEAPSGVAFALETRRNRRFRALTVAASAVAAVALVVALGTAAVASGADSPLWSWIPALASGTAPDQQAAGPAGSDGRDGADGEDGKDAPPSPEASASPGGEPEEAEENGGREAPGSGGGSAESLTGTAVLGPTSQPGSGRPSGSLVVGFAPQGGSARWGVLADGAEVLCAWSFCQDRGGAVSDGAAGTVPSTPQALVDHLSGHARAEILAEVTYTVGDDGTARITRVVERHRAGADGAAPPWA
ncbi:serine/threonine protein kinase [Actinorugispora endophytica]|uniref:Serine/threonine protein kinase n=1 Tax=Actinorugispora endophytica TaxID=1605990 RepID=A0A4R6UW54_9ACTN|nr:serine/threonine-protein kinase [Actinorugispora endophytica]TDQ51590.1 serine/threonine protein kinase [Actinorugispora endophytica]